MGNCFSGGSQDDFGKELLAAHNKYRAQHGAQSLKWSPQAASKAQSWANNLARTNVFKHGNHDGMGQNIATRMSTGPQVDLTGQEATDMWYNEIRDYNFNRPGFASNTGHFTQVVWQGTTQMGAAKAVKGSHVYVVANYTPPGNVVDHFEENVKAN